jgi:hypothetical protein
VELDAAGADLGDQVGVGAELACREELQLDPPARGTDLITQVRTGGIEFLNIAGSVISTVASGAAITNSRPRPRGCAGRPGRAGR